MGLGRASGESGGPMQNGTTYMKHLVAVASGHIGLKDAQAANGAAGGDKLPKTNDRLNVSKAVDTEAAAPNPDDPDKPKYTMPKGYEDDSVLTNKDYPRSRQLQSQLYFRQPEIQAKPRRPGPSELPPLVAAATNQDDAPAGRTGSVNVCAL